FPSRSGINARQAARGNQKILRYLLPFIDSESQLAGLFLDDANYKYFLARTTSRLLGSLYHSAPARCQGSEANPTTTFCKIQKQSVFRQIVEPVRRTTITIAPRRLTKKPFRCE